MIESPKINAIVIAAIEDRPPRVSPAEALYALKAVEAMEILIEWKRVVDI